MIIQGFVDFVEANFKFACKDSARKQMLIEIGNSCESNRHQYHEARVGRVESGVAVS